VPRGKLRIYLGAAPGVGKTYAMLNEARRAKERGTEVVIGYVETHGRTNTEAQIGDLPVISRHSILYRGQELEEMDVDAIIARGPERVLVDELAHTNVPGSRNEKRWQDIDELLNAGIDVLSTVNIQHLAGLNDVVERITGVTQRETVPDAWVRGAHQIELVDMTPEALRRRMAHGNVYRADRVDAALGNYFRAGNLAALRELALLWLADRVEDDLAEYRERHGITEPWETKERVVVALTGAPGGEHLLRRASRMSARAGGELVGVHVRATDGYVHDAPTGLDAQRKLLEELGGRYGEVIGLDIGAALVNFARAENATQLVLGASGRSRLAVFVRGSVINQVVRDAAPIDVHVIASHQADEDRGLPPVPQRHRPAAFPPRRRHLGWVLGTIGILALGLSLWPLRSSLGLSGALLCLLLGVVAVATIGGVQPAVAATVIGSLVADFFFTRPYYSLYIAHTAEIVAVVAFFLAAGAVTLLVDRLARRGLETTRAQAEAEALARLAGEAMPSTPETLPDIVAELRRTFDLEAVAVLRPVGDGWVAVAAAGAPIPTNPAAAPFSAELAEGTVLVLAGSALHAEDTRLLRAFVAQLRIAQERADLQERAGVAMELEEANQLRTALLSAVSHDLRTPLAGIKAAATSILSSDVQWDGQQVLGFAKTIDAQADRLTHLVSNLLDMSRIQAGAVRPTLRPVAIDDVVYDAVESLGPESAGVVVEMADGLPPVMTDAGLLERALANVVDNALHWSPPGIAVRVDGAATDGEVVVRVIDQGPGIPPNQRDEVFRAFQRLGDGAGDSPTGVGLGLAVAQGFTAAVGARLFVDDTPGGGATFVFRLKKATS
jgi:two-component system sensor histidine kinase KdpD